MKQLLLALIRMYQKHVSPGISPPLPVHPHLLPVRGRGHFQVWRSAGRTVGPVAFAPVQPL